MRIVAALLALLVACGGDDPPKGNPTAPAAPAPAAAAPGATPGAGSGKPLPTMRHVEDRVECPPPRTDGKVCDPNATKPLTVGVGSSGAKPQEDKTCPENQACLETKDAGWLCGLCPERFAIRHEFKERDFADETNRDPFQSFVVSLAGAGSGSGADLPKDPGSKCVRPEQLRVTNYGYQDLKLVGIVSQGTQRKVLMMDPGNYGHIIKRGDCVGKEKAWVKDIGENFICFEMSTDAAASARLPEGMCVELHNKQLTVSQLPTDGSSGTSLPPVLPSQNPTPAPQGPTTTIIPARPPVQPVQPAPQNGPPVILKP